MKWVKLKDKFKIILKDKNIWSLKQFLNLVQKKIGMPKN